MNAIDQNTFIGLTTVLGAIFGLVYSLVAQQKKYTRLQKQLRMVEFQIVEKERSRISADLHDNLAPLLSVLKLLLSESAIDSSQADNLERSRELIDNIIIKLRGITYELTPELVVERGLVEAVKIFVAKLNPEMQDHIHFSHSGIGRLPAEIELPAYRIIQEIIHNTIKHAQAKSLFIRLSQDHGKLILKTEDDGIGFNWENAESGLGLLALRNRVDMLNGKLAFDSGRDKGARYQIEIPLTHKIHMNAH